MPCLKGHLTGNLNLKVCGHHLLSDFSLRSLPTQALHREKLFHWLMVINQEKRASHKLNWVSVKTLLNLVKLSRGFV